MERCLLNDVESHYRTTARSHYQIMETSKVTAVADPGFGQGGAKKFSRRFCRRSEAERSEASQHWPGSRAHLRALEALAFLTLKYAFSHFSWYFFFKIFNVFHLMFHVFQHERC